MATVKGMLTFGLVIMLKFYFESCYLELFFLAPMNLAVDVYLFFIEVVVISVSFF